MRDLIRYCTKHTPHSLKTLQTQVLIDAIDDIIHHIHCRRTKASFFTSRVVINEIKGVFFTFYTDCAALVDEIGYKEEPAGDGLPYLTLYYANGPGSRERTNLTGVDTR